VIRRGTFLRIAVLSKFRTIWTIQILRVMSEHIVQEPILVHIARSPTFRSLGQLRFMRHEEVENFFQYSSYLGMLETSPFI
jgi:hypothetical protein